MNTSMAYVSEQQSGKITLALRRENTENANTAPPQIQTRRVSTRLRKTSSPQSSKRVRDLHPRSLRSGPLKDTGRSSPSCCARADPPAQLPGINEGPNGVGGWASSWKKPVISRTDDSKRSRVTPGGDENSAQ
jgi:hypothetical protein